MDVSQFQLFRQITLDYFEKLSPGEGPVVEPPYLQFGEPALLDYASLVRIAGELDGCVYLTAPVPMLTALLEAHGEPEVSEVTLKDVCRELSNVISGNASRAFAGGWEISVPESLGPSELASLTLPPSAFVLPFRWRGTRSLLVIGLVEPERRS